jgi:hypothetical protein
MKQCISIKQDVSLQRQAEETNIMVLVEIDGNYIDAEPMKNKTEGSMIKAYLALWEHLTATGTVLWTMRHQQNTRK